MPDDYLVAITSKNFDAAAEYTKERFNLPESEEEIIKEWFDMAIEAYNQ